MISTFGMLGRTAPLHVYAPAEFGDMLQSQLDFFCHSLGFEVSFHPVDTSANKVVYEDRSLTVTTIPLFHRVPCCGYLFKEKPLLPHIRRELVDAYKIPLSQINNIKNGASWTTSDGRVLTTTELTTPPDPPRSYAYCSDTRYDPSIARAVSGVTMLYHESTYGAEEQERAAEFSHSTATDAARTALEAGAAQLLLGHFSARYEDEAMLLREAQAVFPNTNLAQEGEIFEIMP